MDRKVAIAAVVSALASGGVAVAVSYRLWGAGVTELREREVAVEAAVTELDKRRIKTDDTIIGLIDTFKEAEAKFTAARTAKAVQPGWHCTLFFDGRCTGAAGFAAVRSGLGTSILIGRFCNSRAR